jgi:hypothetical protein
MRHSSKKPTQRATLSEGLNWLEIQYMLFPDLRWISSTENFFEVDRLALFAQIVHFQRRRRGHDSAISGETLRRGVGVGSDYSNQVRTRCSFGSGVARRVEDVGETVALPMLQHITSFDSDLLTRSQ